MIPYSPSPALLEKYASLLVNFCLNGGKGIKKGEVVAVQLPECAKPFYVPLQQAVLNAGGFPIMRYQADGVSRAFLEGLNEEMLEFYPRAYLFGLVEETDHMINIIATADKHEMDGIDTKKLFKRAAASKFFRDAYHDKEDAGKLTWTLGMYATQAMAAEVGMSLEEYRGEIISACYLDADDPIAEWQKIYADLKTITTTLDAMAIESVHMHGDDCDLAVAIGANRKRLAGSGRNMPSYEVFTSPDRRGTTGWIRFNQPLYRFGSLIKDVFLRFEDGIVVEAIASENEEMLRTMIEQENANKLGEFSMTDRRMSRIHRLMGETLYDENRGGKRGNSHVAVGNSFKDAYRGEIADVTDEQREQMGFNDSVVHTDIVTTTNRTVTATCADGTEQVIYKNGQFVFLER